MSKSNHQSILSSLKPSKAIVSLAIPATLALLAKAVYNLVDTAYIGMLDSDIALTAVGVTVPLLLIMVSVENIFAAGAAVAEPIVKTPVFSCIFIACVPLWTAGNKSKSSYPLYAPRL